jgi:hypothetical protein
LGPIVALAAALAIGVAVWATSGDDGGGSDGGASSTRTTPAEVEVTSDAPRHATLAELVAASDLVVRADVLRTEHGRVFGEPGSGAAIESRVVTLSITRVLHDGGTGTGTAPGRRLLVEEEGWTADGAPLVVDGLAPSSEGDDAIWFLTRVGEDEEVRYVVVGPQGRYRITDGRLVGARGDDPLIASTSAMAPDALEAAVQALP